MKKKFPILASLALIFAIVGTAYGLAGDPRANEITNFEPGHTHESGITEGAPQHSGGTNKFGCHNASVPYHCH